MFQLGILNTFAFGHQSICTKVLGDYFSAKHVRIYFQHRFVNLQARLPSQEESFDFFTRAFEPEPDAEAPAEPEPAEPTPAAAATEEERPEGEETPADGEEAATPKVRIEAINVLRELVTFLEKFSNAEFYFTLGG